MLVLVARLCQLFVTPWTVAHVLQAPVSMEFSRQEYSVGCHFLLQGIFLTQGSNLSLLHWQMDSLPLIQLQFSYSVVSDSLRPHGLQHARLPYPLPTPGACSNSCPSSWWCHPTILSSVVPFSSCLQSFPASGSFPMSQFFTLGGQSIGVSASTSSSVLQHSTFFMVQFLHPYTTTGKTIALTIWSSAGKVMSLLSVWL